ncbi:MAG TPA: prenyltransferase/squalene oxidase repeat-containing protein [Lacipirellulaceae bacterium]
MLDVNPRSPAGAPAAARTAARTASTLAARPAHAPGDETPLIDLGGMLRESPPWLLSAAVHMLAMIIFGIMFVQAQTRSELVLDAGYSEDFGEEIEEDLELATDTFEVEEYKLTAQDLPIVEDPLAAPEVAQFAPNPAMPVGTVTPTTIGLAFTGREPGMKEALLQSSGGTGKTENAVAMGLRWLANRQQKNGLWSLSGPYEDGSRTENVEAATAMALLAFQGAGYTPDGPSEEPYTRVVRRGWDALLARMEEDGRFFHVESHTHQLYTQAQCTIALCELYAMTGDQGYYDAAQKAVDYCVRIQAPEGGWRYHPGTESDMSVTGWFVMALQSARMAGIEVPSPVFDRIQAFLDSVAREDGSRYAYRFNDGATLPLTAEGLLCRQYLGWQRDDPRLNAGVEYLLANLPEWDERNVYYWYYATQVLHHMEGKPWRSWNEEMRKLLPEHQVTRGRERGSWDPGGDRWGSEGGRLYVTCLSIYILEVYYRHLPLYRTGLFDHAK